MFNFLYRVRQKLSYHNEGQKERESMYVCVCMYVCMCMYVCVCMYI
jgi:hypothetical protein